MRFGSRRNGLFALAAMAVSAVVVVGVVASGVASGSSEDSDGMAGCPPASNWALAAWLGADGATASSAFETCDGSAVDIAYWIDPDSQSWSRFVSGQPDITNLLTLDKGQAVLALGSDTAAPSASAIASAAGYAGSEACQSCHAEQYNLFSVSGHPWKLVTREQAQARNLPLPKEVDGWDDVSYVIGGYKWKARYIDNDGFIITGKEDSTTQYNMLTGNWVPYHAGEVKEYTCGGCHTTGWVAATSELTNGAANGADISDRTLLGMAGTFVFGGVECENCHGPAADHVAGGGSPKPTKDDSAAFCGSCHIRGDADTIPAKGGFIRHHEQYNEFLASPHDSLDCVTCHDPHAKSEFSIETECADCHSGDATEFAGSSMDEMGVTCTDCHMPMASKSAEALGDHQGDVMTHLFKINTDATASMFSEDGSLVALDAEGKGAVTLDFACLQCHQTKDVAWAASFAEGVHSQGK